MKIRESIKEASTELLRDIKEHPWKYEYNINDEESRQIYEEVCKELRKRQEEAEQEHEFLKEKKWYHTKPELSVKEETKHSLYGFVVIILLFSFFAWICIELTESKEVYIEIPSDSFVVGDYSYAASVNVNNPTEHFIVVYRIEYSLWTHDKKIVYGTRILNEDIEAYGEKSFSVGTIFDHMYLPKKWYEPYIFIYRLEVRVFYMQYNMKEDTWESHSVWQIHPL